MTFVSYVTSQLRSYYFRYVLVIPRNFIVQRGKYNGTVTRTAIKVNLTENDSRRL